MTAGQVADVFEMRDDHAFIVALWDIVWDRQRAVGIGRMSEAERLVSDVCWLEAEVNNGGFEQYFDNGSGDRWKHVGPALTTIGATRAADIFRRAIEVFGSDLPSEEAAVRAAQVQRLVGDEEDEGPWEELDDEFYTYPDDLTALLAAYAREHQSQFQSAPNI